MQVMAGAGGASGASNAINACFAGNAGKAGRACGSQRGTGGQVAGSLQSGKGLAVRRETWRERDGLQPAASRLDQRPAEEALDDAFECGRLRSVSFLRQAPLAGSARLRPGLSACKAWLSARAVGHCRIGQQQDIVTVVAYGQDSGGSKTHFDRED